LVNGGDSGAPVFKNNTAYGIVHGEYDYVQLIFVASNYVESGIGVTILTQ
jgi:hypothetical protein